jgi:hypothetical protein
MQGPDFCCGRIFKLMPRWDICKNVLGDYFEKLYISGINELHLIFMT